MAPTPMRKQEAPITPALKVGIRRRLRSMTGFFVRLACQTYRVQTRRPTAVKRSPIVSDPVFSPSTANPKTKAESPMPESAKPTLSSGGGWASMPLGVKFQGGKIQNAAVREFFEKT